MHWLLGLYHLHLVAIQQSCTVHVGALQLGYCAVCFICYCSTHITHCVTCPLLYIHLFAVIVSATVQPDPNSLINLAPDGYLTIAPVDVDYPMQFDIFLTVSC